MNINKLVKSYKKTVSSDKKFFDTTVKIRSELNVKLNEDKNSATINQSLGIDVTKNKINGIPFIDAISKAWQLSKMLSFISIKTLEYKIDNENSIYYVVPAFRIPIVNIDFPVKPPSSKITQLTQSALNYMLPVNKQNEKQKIYEFNGHYYLDRKNAKEDLLNAMYQRPEKYAQNKNLYVSIMSKDDVWKLPSEIAEAKICGATSDDKGCITNAQYAEKLGNEKNKFVDHIFDKEYKSREKTFYLDGFNKKDELNYFDTKQEAIASLEEKLSQVKFNPKYRYVTSAGKTVTLDSKEEILAYIHDNEIVESKYIINSDLIVTSNYNDLAEYQNVDFDVYHLQFYGEDKYFMSYDLVNINFSKKKILTTGLITILFD